MIFSGVFLNNYCFQYQINTYRPGVFYYLTSYLSKAQPIIVLYVYVSLVKIKLTATEKPRILPLFFVHSYTLVSNFADF